MRWEFAWPEFRSGQWVGEPKDREIEQLLALAEKLEWIRRNLSFLSSFMARWKEPMSPHFRPIRRLRVPLVAAR